MSAYSDKFRSNKPKAGPAHGPQGQHDSGGTPEHKLASLGVEARQDAPTGRIADVDLGRGSEFTYAQTPSGATCRGNGSKNLGIPATTGGSSTSRNSTAAVTSTPPAWSGNEPDCPIRSQESIDNFQSPNRPKPQHPGVKIVKPAESPSGGGGGSRSGGKKYNPSGLPKWSEEGIWGQYRPRGGK